MKCAYRANCFVFLAPFTIFPDSLNVGNIYTEMTTAHQWLCPETISVLICMFRFIIVLTYLSVAKPGRGKPFFFLACLNEWSTTFDNFSKFPRSEYNSSYNSSCTIIPVTLALQVFRVTLRKGLFLTSLPKTAHCFGGSV